MLKRGTWVEVISQKPQWRGCIVTILYGQYIVQGYMTEMIALDPSEVVISKDQGMHY